MNINESLTKQVKALREAAEDLDFDETDLDSYADDEDFDEVDNLDFGEPSVESGESFEDDYIKYKWEKPFGEVKDLADSKIQIWSAVEITDEEVEPVYFVVDIETGFIEFGPSEDINSAQEYVENLISGEFEDNSEELDDEDFEDAERLDNDDYSQDESDIDFSDDEDYEEDSDWDDYEDNLDKNESLNESRWTPCDDEDEFGHHQCPYTDTYTGYEDEMCRNMCGLGADEDSYDDYDLNLYDDEDYDDSDINIGEEEFIGLEEDVEKCGSKWCNKGKEGTHGKFNTKKEATAQTRAMYANGYNESLNGTQNTNADVFNLLKSGDTDSLSDMGDRFYDDVCEHKYDIREELAKMIEDGGLAFLHIDAPEYDTVYKIFDYYSRRAEIYDSEATWEHAKWLPEEDYFEFLSDVINDDLNIYIKELEKLGFTNLSNDEILFCKVLILSEVSEQRYIDNEDDYYEQFNYYFKDKGYYDYFEFDPPEEEYVPVHHRNLKEDLFVLVPNDTTGCCTEEECEPCCEEQCADNCVRETAKAVMDAYQTANKWLDSVKESVYHDMSCVFFSSYIHNLAHTMPGRFDEFGDILHTMNIKIPYPATAEIAKEPENIDEVFIMIFGLLDAIKQALNNFIKCTDENYHGMACAAEGLLNDIESEDPMLFRLKSDWEQCHGDNIKFDKYVNQYVKNKDDLLEALQHSNGLKPTKYAGIYENPTTGRYYSIDKYHEEPFDMEDPEARMYLHKRNDNYRNANLMESESRLKITFEYKDSMSRGKWNTQTCICSSVKECKEWYGLGIDPDCEYRIISIEDLDNLNESEVFRNSDSRHHSDDSYKIRKDDGTLLKSDSGEIYRFPTDTEADEFLRDKEED